MIRVLVVSPRALFGEAVEDWLRQQRNLDVIGWEAETGRALERIQQLAPDVLIVDTSTICMDPAVALMKFLSNRADSQIVGLDLRNNSLSIFTPERQATTQLAVLLGLLGEQSRAQADLASGADGAREQVLGTEVAVEEVVE